MALKLAKNAKNALSLAKLEAKRYNLVYIGTELVLLALVEERGSVAQRVFSEYNIDAGRLRREVESNVLMGEQPLRPGQVIRAAPLVRRVVEMAQEETNRLGGSMIDCDHLLLALIRERNGVAAEVLDNLNIDRDEMRERIMKLLRNGGPSASTSNEAPFGELQQAVEEESSPYVDMDAGDIGLSAASVTSTVVPEDMSPADLVSESAENTITAAALLLKSLCDRYVMLKAEGKDDQELLDFLKQALRGR